MLVARNAELATENAALKARLGQNSSNSSRPPSTDPPHLKAKVPRRRSKRRPGGQPGHEGHARELVPADRVDKVEDLFPGACQQCGEVLLEKNAEPEPQRHQVAEIPEITPTVTEYRAHEITCGQCGTATRASIPPHVSRSSFGPNLRALLSVLSGRYRMSRRETVELCRELFGLSVSLGSVDNICQRMGAALAGPVAEIEAAVKQAKVVHMDESGWRERGVRAWIWVVVVCKVMTLFKIATSRGGDVARGILGDLFAGQLITDRFSAYAQFPVDQRQVCWSHLVRDFQALIDRGGPGQAIGEAALRLSRRLFLLWHAFKDGKLERDVMRRRMARVEAELGALLQHGTENPDARARRFCATLLTVGAALFLFARVDGVDPTNNEAERAVRPAVLWRKGSFGTASPSGSRFVERMLTVTMTRRQQGRPLLPYLRDVIIAADRGEAAPSLLTAQAQDAPKRRGARKRSGTVSRKRRR